jgi:predicted ATPase/DNA-binding SARP family transcriptional activator
MEFRILGTLEVRADGGPVALGGAKPRGLLAVLLLHPNEPVSAERLALALWGEDAPAGAVKTIHVHVSRLRRALANPGVLATTPAGYLLRVAPDELDADRFERLSAEGHEALADDRPERAAITLREALALWRGPALADLAFGAFAQAEVARLEEERLSALEARVEADLALGGHAELVGELQQLVALHPLRERLHGQLMRSLYGSGRQADALKTYRDARDVLVERLAIEPGPELRALERAILMQDPVLDPAPRARRVVRLHERATAARIIAPATPTVGREGDLMRLRGLLSEAGNRLITVVGPGGVGKTRVASELARAAADQFGDGVYLVSLAEVRGHGDVASTIARQLDVTPMPPESAQEGLTRHLGDRELLLVLDNFEHVLEAAPLVAQLLAATTELSVMVTSREPLRLRAERLYRLEPLALPAVEDDAERARVEEAPAVALFLAVARARDPSFVLDELNAPAVARVCRRLDGLPLAIELAAARVGLLTVPELADRLRKGLDALGSAPRDAPPRQRTLTATLEWSYTLLTADEQAALAGLAVFAGGCTLDAAQAVTGASLEVLEPLVEKHLVVHRPAQDGRARLVLLETVGDFAHARLDERADCDAVRRRHCNHYLALAERTARELERSDPPALMAALDREVHNLRAALSWALEQRDALSTLRLATALREYWHRRGPREGARWLRAALALPGDHVPASTRAAALGACAFCLVDPGTLEDAEAAARESLELARSIGDVAQCAASMTALAAAALEAHRPADGYRYATEAEQLAHEAHAERMRTIALDIRALTAPTFGETLALGEQAAAAHRRAGSARGLALLQTGLTYNALLQGEHAAAERLTPDALRAAETLGDPFVLSAAHGNEGLVSLLTGDVERASEAFTRELELANEYQYARVFYEGVSGLAGVAAARGEDELAARLSGAAEASGRERHPPALARQLEAGFFAPARARLGEQAWRDAHATGAALTPRQAVETALQPHGFSAAAGPR